MIFELVFVKLVDFLRSLYICSSLLDPISESVISAYASSIGFWVVQQLKWSTNYALISAILSLRFSFEVKLFYKRSETKLNANADFKSIKNIQFKLYFSDSMIRIITKSF